MKIAFVPATFLPSIGGAEIQAHNLANFLKENGTDVEVILPYNLDTKINKYKIKKINKHLINFVYLLKYYLGIDISKIVELYFKYLKINRRYDIWHFHSLNYKTLILINILKNLNQKICLTLQGADIQIDQEISYGYRIDQKYNKLFLKTLSKIDLFFSISNNIRDDLLNLNISKKKIVKLPNTILMKKFDNNFLNENS